MYQKPLYESDSEHTELSDHSFENDKVSRLHKYYTEEVNAPGYVKKMVDKCESNSDASINEKHVKKNDLSCNMCDSTKDNYIILSCNHIFHVGCLVSNHFKDIYNYAVIDTEYFSTRTCPTCNCNLQTEEIMYLHSKFLSGTKNMISCHEESIKVLENQLKQLKNELRTCYDYKQKLEQEREKSKQIVSIISTMM